MFGALWAASNPDATEGYVTNQEHVHLATAARVKPGGIGKRIVSFGGEQKWYWMTICVNQPRAPKDYHHVTEQKWRPERPFGIDYREDSSKPDTHKLVVRLDGMEEDLTDSSDT